MLKGKLFVSLLVLIACLQLSAKVTLPRIFGNSMVLQRDQAVPVWGFSEKGKTITVTFAGQTKTATADDSGKWELKLDAMPANAKGQEMTVTSGSGDKVVFKDVLVGEVWICSGQSNMEWNVGGSFDPANVSKAANKPLIRHFKVPRVISNYPLTDLPGNWVICSPRTVNGFTAVGYFFADSLFKELNVPIGLINTSWGGTRIEPWTAPVGFYDNPELKKIAEGVKKTDLTSEDGKAAYKKYLESLKKWTEMTDARVSEGKMPTEPPVFQGSAKNNQSPTAIYNAMVHPLIPYAIRGAIWYQGESNGGEGITYYHKMNALIKGWRKLWNQGDFPFYYVQLANYQAALDKPGAGNGYAKLRDAQLKSLDIPNTGMAVIIDIGEAKNIHPKNKQDVGKRLALWALKDIYGKDVVKSGPLYKGHKVEGEKIRVSFDHVGSGLMVGKKDGLKPTEEVQDGKLKRFAIAGKDKQWVWADAVIDGNDIILSSEKVKEPVAVRYAFSMNPAGANLYNKEGLPASPFRTDSW